MRLGLLFFVAFEGLMFFVVFAGVVQVGLAHGCMAVNTLLILFLGEFDGAYGKWRKQHSDSAKNSQGSQDFLHLKFSLPHRSGRIAHPMPRIFLRLLLTAIVRGTPVSAQEPVYTLKVDIPLVSVDVTVEDPEGNVVSNLPRENFEVYEDGVRQDLRNFSPVSTPYNIFLLFDRSGSTQHKWIFMERAVASFVAGLRSQDRLAIATFDYKLESQLPWTGDRAKAVRSLTHLINPKVPGETNLYDSVERVLRREFDKVSGRRALVVLTDGRDTSLFRSLARTNRL